MNAPVKTWKCEVCGYIHQGDTPPDVCPVCGVGPEMFSPFEVVAAPARQAVSRLTPLCAGEESGDALRMSPLFKQGNAQVSQT